MNRAIAIAIALLSMPLSAAAQSGPPPLTQGPMTVTRLDSGWVVAPDFKITDVDGATSGLAGAYAGWLANESFFIGGGGYWLANGNSNRKLAYGGLIMQWQARSAAGSGFTAKMLIGGGQATLSNVYAYYAVPDPRANVIPPPVTATIVRYSEGIYVWEPEVGGILKLAKGVRLTGGVGWRFVGANGYDSTRLGGAVGSVGLQIGGGS